MTFDVAPDAAWRQVMDTPGLTYRRFDYWCAKDWIRHTTAGGTGNPRTLLDPAEVTVVQTMTALVVAGLKPASAAPLARQLAELGVASLGRFTILDRTGT